MKEVSKKSAPRVGLQIDITENGVRTVKVCSNKNRAAGLGFYLRLLPLIELLSAEAQRQAA